jgi:hypothetical protein
MSSIPTGEVSLANFRSVFGPGGTNQVLLSEYYQNATTSYAHGVSGIPNIGSSIAYADYRGKFKAAPAVQGWAHQFSTAGTGASSSGLFFGQAGSILAVFRLRSMSGFVVSNPANLTFTVFSNSFKAPEIRVSFSSTFKGTMRLERSDNGGSTWRETARVFNFNGTTYVFGYSETGDI